MKGKGKALGSDCPLQYPDLKPVDHMRLCPRYTQVMVRPEESSIGIEEVDTLQTELETLLASVAKRMRLMESEMAILNNWQDTKDKKGLIPSSKGLSNGKRGKGADEKTAKKFKDSAGKATFPPGGANRPKNKNIQNDRMYEFVESPIELPRIPKNETPNRFWSFVEPYCQEITSDDLKVLEQLLSDNEDNSDYFKIPSLGRHYSERWAQEDLLEEQKEGIKILDKKRSGTTNHSDVDLLLKTECNGDSTAEDCPFGPFTQRLISALIEENIMTAIGDESMNDASESASSETIANMSPRALAKQLNIGNPSQLERRIKRELEDQGILEAEEHHDDGPDNELLIELRRKQQELKAVSQHNRLITKKLHKLAKEEVAKQELKSKMAAADVEVMDAFRKIQAARQKKKLPTKKEKEAAMKALKERKAIVNELERMEGTQ